MASATSATKDWAGDTERAGDKAEVAAKKSEGAFSRISRAIRSTRAEAKKGAEFAVKTDERGFSGLMKRIKGVRSEAEKGADFAVRADERGFSGILSRIRGVRKEASRDATMGVNFEQRGAAGVIASGKAVGASMDRLDGRDVTVDINADQKGLSGLKGGLGEVASGIRNVSTVAKASALPVMIASAGAAIPTVLALGGSLGGLALNLGKAGAGFALVAGAAGAGAVAGLMAYAKGISSVVSASREAYAATHEQAMEQLAQQRNTILNTKASVAFNEEINRQVLGLTRLQAAVGSRVFPMFTTEMRSWGGVLEQNQGKIVNTAGVVSKTATGFSKWFRTAEQGAVLDRTLGFINSSTVKGADALSGAGKAGLMAFLPLIPLASRLQGKVVGLAQSAAKWTASSEGQSKLGAIYRSLYADAAKLGPVLMNAARGTAGLFSAIDQAGLADQASAGLATLAAGYAKIGVKGSEARTKVVGFLSQSKALMPFVAGAAGKLAGSVGRIASGAISMRAEGSKLTVLQGVFKGVGDSAAPLERLLLGTFKALGPELVTLIPNVAMLSETFAGSTGPLVLYAQTANRLMGAFNSLSPGTKTLVANLVGLKVIMGSMGFGGMISGLWQAYVNQRLLSTQSKILKFQQGGVAASNVAVGTTSTAAAGGMTRMAVAGRALRLVMATLVLPVAAVVGLGAAFFVAYNKSERFRAGVDKLDTALIGTKNTAEITKNGWRGVGNVASDNSGISILWARDLGKVEVGMRQNSEAATPFNKAMLDLGQRMRDNKGISGGLSGVWKSLKTTMTDNKGVSDLWARGTGNLTSKLQDNKGASGALKNALGALKETAEGAGQGFNRLAEQGLAQLGELKNRGVELAGNIGAGLVNRFEEMRSGSHGKFQQQTAQGLEKLGELARRGGVSIGSFVKGGLDKYTEMREGGATRFEALRGTVVDRLSEAKTRGIQRTHEMGTELMASWGRQSEKAGERYSQIRDTIGDKLREGKTWGIDRIHELGTEAYASWGRQSEKASERYSQIRDTIGDKLREGRNWGTDRIKELGGNLRDAFGRQLEATGAFGDKFKEILGDKFGGAVNLARKWLGSLMFAAGYVLKAIGAGELAGDANELGKNLQTPKKFARGGVWNADRGGVGDGHSIGAITNEAGDREAIINLDRKTPESQQAFRAASSSPNATPEDWGHGGLPEPPGAKRRAERERLQAPLTKSTKAGGGVYTGWDNVVDSYGYAKYNLATRFGAAYDRALSAWDDGRSPIDMRKGTGGPSNVRVADDYYGTGYAPAWASPATGITNNLSHMAGYTTDENNALATHEVGHTLGLGHGIPPPSIMNYASTYTVGAVPTSNDWSYLQKLWGPGGGSGGKKDPSGSHEESDLKNYSSNFDSGTQPHVARVANYMNDKFPAIDVIGGYRPGDPQDHGKGLAIDMMTGPHGSSGANNGLMDSITSHMKANWDAMALTYLISRQRIDTGGGWAAMENRGNNTENHMDHVHASFSPNAGSGIVSGAGGGGGGGLFDWMGAITSGLSKVPAFPDLGLGMVGTGIGQLGPMLLGKAKDWLIDKAKGIFGSAKDTLGDAYNKITGGGDPAKNRAMGQEMLPKSSTGGSFGALDSLWTKESQWDHKAQNPTSTAFGIPQFLDMTWAQYGGKSTDPKGQIGKGLEYIKDRYTTTDAAWGHSQQMGWYEKGGVIPGAAGQPVLIQAHAGERVLPREVVTSFDRLANSVTLWSKKQQGTGTVEIRQTGGDSSGEMPREELRAIRSELAAMRRTLAQEIGNEVGGKLMGKPGERNKLRHDKSVNERHKAAGLIA